MNQEEILKIVNEICKDVFENDELIITNDTIAKDVPGWDSLAHLSLINEIENEFNIKLKLKEIQGAKNVGELINFISNHLEGEQ